MCRWPPRLALLPVVLLLVIGAARGSLAQTPTMPAAVSVSGLIVDYGDGQRTYALVPFPGETATGVDVLQRSGLSLLTVGFGGMGEGICAIENVGCDLSACRARLCQTGDPDSPFWQYVRLGDDGTWQPAPLGASSSTVQDGDVEGWFWTGKTPQAGGMTFASIADITGTNLDLFPGHGDDVPAPVVVTAGANPESDAFDTGAIAGGIGAMAAVAVLGGMFVLRSRRQPR